MTGSYRSFIRQTCVGTVLVLAVLPAFGAAEEPVVGRWLAEGFERGDHLQVFFDLRTDGTYEKAIRVIDSNWGIEGEAKETGKWTFQRGNLAIVSEAVDGKPVTGSVTDTHDLFRVDRVDDEHINLFDTE